MTNTYRVTDGPQVRRMPNAFGFSFWVMWVLGTALSLTVGVFAGLIASANIFLLGNILFAPMSENINLTLYYVLWGVPTGTSVGIIQWLLLRRRLHKISNWIWVNIVGWAVAFGMVSVTSVRETDGLQNAAGFLVWAAGMGIVQWLLLRREVSRAAWWIPASAVGWPFGLLLSENTGMQRLVGFAAFVAVVGVGAGAITGAALVRLLRQPRQ